MADGDPVAASVADSAGATGSRTLAGVLAFHARTHGDDLFVVFESEDGSTRAITYGEMMQRAEKAAGALMSLGVGPGDTFNLHLPNCLEFVDLWLGATLLGAVMVPTNPLFTEHELAYVLNHAGCKVAVTTPATVEPLRHAKEVSSVECVVATGTHAGDADAALEDILDTASAVPLQPSDDPRATAGILYTSGTTSRPKGVVVTNRSYLFAGEAVAQHLRLRPDDRHLVVLPLFHGNAQYYSTMSTLVTGASMALMSRFSASAWSDQVSRHGATIASLFAAPIRMILAQRPSRQEGENGLRVALFAQNLTSAQVIEFERRFQAPLVQLYGMTETVAPPTIIPVYGDRRHDSIGLPAIHARIRVVDEKGADVPPETPGELLVAGELGATLMAGYLDDEEATNRALSGGWLRTGDTVRQGRDGYLYFVDRSKDLIKRGGENISASEIEQILNEHPSVFESAVIGVPDDIRDEAIRAFVVLRGGVSLEPESLVDWCSERLARFKVPSEVTILPELPRTSVGKIQKHRLPL